MKKPDYNRSIFLDSSNLKEIEKWNNTGIIDGITTNQSIMLKDGLNLKDLEPTIKKICKIMKGKPVSIELSDSQASIEQMVKEAKKYRKMADNVVIKVPVIPSSTKTLEVIKKLSDLKIPLNVTAIMNFEQLLTTVLALRNHPSLSFVSLFWARSLEDHEKYRTNKDFVKSNEAIGPESYVNSHPSKIVSVIMKFKEVGGYDNPKLIIGSIRNASQVGEAFASGANIVTIQPKTLETMLFSQRTVETNSDFDKAWKTLIDKSI